MGPDVTGFFDSRTSTVTYVVRDPGSTECAVIDPVLDYDPAGARLFTESVDTIATFLDEHALSLTWILDTHAHADHLSGAQRLKALRGGSIAIGEHITDVQTSWKAIYNLCDAEFVADGSQFDRLVREGDRLPLGGLEIEVWHTPGHTPGCVTYLVGDAAFVGDTMFMPDHGTARADFPGGDARTLYRSIRRILSLPGETRLFVCHDYQPGGRELAFETTVAAQRAENPHVRDGIDIDTFVEMRETRDRTLGAPELLLPAVQVNIRGGGLPPAEDNGTRYLKIPLDRF